MKKGSYHENGKIPEIGQKVFFLRYKSGTIKFMADAGIVKLISNIDNRGIGNFYMDIENKKGQTFHCNIGEVFDHKPKLIPITDCYGETKRWV